MSKYDYVKDEWVKQALEEYKDKIDNNKSHKLDVSSYKVDKPWGHEIWLELNEFYALDEINDNCLVKALTNFLLKIVIAFKKSR